MDNKTQSFQFRKTKLALAVAMTVGLAACGVDGDEGSVSTSTATTDASQPTQVNVSEPTGTVQGVVLDTNGNPVVGATVTIGSLTGVTDSSGSYSVADVKVTNVAGADAATGHDPIVVVIQAADSTMYASTATVVVNPMAQVDATNGNENGGDDSAGDSVGAPLTTFIDGFTAQADTAILPKKNSVIEGWLRSHATGEAIANQEVSLDFTGLSTTIIAGDNIGNFTLSGDHFKATTNDQGYFRFENVYADSQFNINTSDYTFSSTGNIASKNIEVTEVLTVGSSAASTLATANNVNAGSVSVLRVNGQDQSARFDVVNGVLTARDGTNPVVPANNVLEFVTLGDTDTASVPVAEYVSSLDSITVQGALDTEGNANAANYNAIVASGGQLRTADGVAVAASADDRVLVQYDALTPVLPANASVVVTYEYATGASTTTNAGGQTSSVNGVTTNEMVENNVGTLTVTPIVSNDTVSPYVSNVDGWIRDSASGYGILNKGVNKTFTIHFSERLATTFNKDGILVTDATATLMGVDSIELADDMRSVTITLTEEQDPGTKLQFFFPWQDTTDVAGNYLSTTANDSMDIDFDSRITATSGKASFLRVNLCVFKDAVINPTGYAAVQDFDIAVGTDAGSTDLAAYSNAFLDNHTETGDVNLRQLNGDADSTTFLDALGDLVSGTNIAVDNDHAWVKVTRGEASAYTYTGGTGTSTDSSVWFDGVKPGDSKTFTFLNDLSLAAGSVKVTLVDAIKPTTTLQQNYTLSNAITTNDYAARIVTSGAIATQGAGGEVTEAGEAATIGNPIVYIQPRHLTPTDATSNTADRGDEYDTLVDDVAGRSAVVGTPTPTSVQDTTATSGNDPFVGSSQPIYDDAAFASWTAAERANSLGVSFTEDIALVSGSSPIFSGTGVTIGNFSALVDVENNIDGTSNGTDNDLVRMEVSDMVALANDNHNTTIAFSGDVQDAHANIADDNSRATVVIRDAMPPMVTSASYNGSDLTIEFNEALGSRTALNGAVIGIDDFIVAPEIKQSITLNSAASGLAAGAFTVSADGKTLTVQVGGASAAISDLFDNATAEYQWQEVGTTTTLESHVALSWDSVEDARGNSWDSFDTDTVIANALPTVITKAGTRYLVEAPRFYMYDNVGPFQYTVATQGYDAGAGGGDDDGNITFTITFTHPIDLALGNAFSDRIDLNDGGGTTNPISVLSYSTANATGAAVLDGLFTVDVNGDDTADRNFVTGVPTDGTEVSGSMTIGNGNTTITLLVDGAVEEFVHPTSKFGFQTTVTSAINGDVTTAGTFNWQNTN